MKCVIYTRVSSKDQETEGFSIPAQAKLLREYAQRNGLQVVAEFSAPETAKKAGRCEFNRMIAFLKDNPNSRTILVEKTDRLYRNFKDFVTIEELDCAVHLVKEGEVISKDSRSHAKFIHGIKVLMAKNYCDNLSEEVKKGLSEKAAQGKWPHRAPVGYVNDITTHTIHPDPQKQEFIRELFERYASGNATLSQLAQFARSSALFSRNSQVINKAGIHRILTNPIYCGEFEWKGKRYLGNHELIISRKLFDEVQTVLRGGKTPTPSVNDFAFAGLVKCGICRCAMTAEIKKGKYVYYHCTSFHGKCGNTYVRQETLDQMFAEVVGRVKVHPSVVEDIKVALLESQKDRIAFEAQSTDTLRRRETHIQTLLDRAYEDKLSGIISPELWDRKSREWQDELISVRQKLAAYGEADRNYYQLGVQILELANSAYGMYLAQTGSEKAKLLRTLLSNSTFTRGTLCPTYKNPFDILAKGAEFQSKRG